MIVIVLENWISGNGNLSEIVTNAVWKFCLPLEIHISVGMGIAVRERMQ